MGVLNSYTVVSTLAVVCLAWLGGKFLTLLKDRQRIAKLVSKCPALA